jgi:hypothetical protein
MKGCLPSSIQQERAHPGGQTLTQKQWSRQSLSPAAVVPRFVSPSRAAYNRASEIFIERMHPCRFPEKPFG